MNALGFLICCAGSGLFGWVLHRATDRSLIVHRDERDYRRQHISDVIDRTLHDARTQATHRRYEPVIDLRDER